ncbi:uncharacterized protein SPAPADRAFT_64446 [Spathaspora passalidarum NRRL Y-27907]|uniref:BZIP domain-containing protein n=1 Tax=Spathaspora passalidarum (strain NRRL Y-27907 / 11-Y1) TaxID=619300 RepID=G3AGG1_SPAPN|nr:uncharacterized protein SPAPADRAFT_64446 [Spathaspora passalidarum NRRL Y-27907]EGW35300.1 hypothetical protein SPAPADRAFT_64446 [Spathaspora passalidarum NRRL Y-27907]
MDATVSTSPSINTNAINNTANPEEAVDMASSFKTALPPRKRAKTKEEKEQRRVERILRNRRAAHASREKKRKHVEYLEAYVVELEANLLKVEENFSAVSKLVSEEQLKSVGLQALKDLSELKQKIHDNLSSSRKSSSNNQNHHDDDLDDDIEEEEEHETPNKKRKVKTEVEEQQPLQQQQPTRSTSLVFEEKMRPIKQESNDYITMGHPIQEPCNYLSPISINSPINSPIDLTMRTTSQHSQSPSPLLSSTSSSIPTTPSSSMSSPKHHAHIHDSYELGQNSAAPVIPEFLDLFEKFSEDGFIMTEEEDGHDERIQVGIANDDNYGLDIEEFLSF